MNLATLFQLALASLISLSAVSSWGYSGNYNNYNQTNRATSAGQNLYCLNNAGQILPVDDENVLQMKVSTKNSYLARAHISGVITNLYSDRTGHKHFQLHIGPQVSDTIEVVYNEDFGKTSNVVIGATAEACGDYITSNRDAAFKASPDGAIIHWVHRSPDLNRHASGFLLINGVLVGQNAGQ